MQSLLCTPMGIVMARLMSYLEIPDSVGSSINDSLEMMRVKWFFVEEWLSAYGAHPTLLVADGHLLAVGCVAQLAASGIPPSPILPQRWVHRGIAPLNEYMPDNGRLAHLDKGRHDWLTAPIAPVGGKYPATASDAPKVALPPPACGLPRMASFAPTPEHPEDSGIDVAEDGFADHVSVVLCPSSQDKVEIGDDRLLLFCRLVSYPALQLSEPLEHLFLLRFDEQLAFIPTEVEPKEIESVIDMDDAGLFFVELEPTFGKPRPYAWHHLFETLSVG